jgi:hypothetical protein
MAGQLAEPGDVCILLEPHADEFGPLLERQLALQEVIGGDVVQPVHLTCQRIKVESPALGDLQRALRRLAAKTRPFALTAVAFRSVYSPYRQAHFLKWEVFVHPALRSFSERLQRLLDACGLTSLYGRDWTSSWVSALEGIRNGHNLTAIWQAPMPEHLFMARRIEVSRILGPTTYETIDLIELGAHER